MGSNNANPYLKLWIPAELLDDLCCRFIINVPPEDRKDMIRMCFHIEQAHWFFLDFYCTNKRMKLRPCGFMRFAAHIFHHVPQLREYTRSLHSVVDNWRNYKQSVPTFGAILLDTDLSNVLLVCSYWTKASWSFPKGKINQGEEPWTCAVREVLEETGFDISNLINMDDYIETIIHAQIVGLFIIRNIPRDTKFQPQTRNEIKACEWFPLNCLPVNKRDNTPTVKMGYRPNAFFMVFPFIKQMRRWVAERNPKAFTNSAGRMHLKSMGDIESAIKTMTISQELQNEIQDYQTNFKYYKANFKFERRPIRGFF